MPTILVCILSLEVPELIGDETTDGEFTCLGGSKKEDDKDDTLRHDGRTSCSADSSDCSLVVLSS